MEKFLYRLNGGPFERDYIVSENDGFFWPPPKVILVKDQDLGVYKRTWFSSAEKAPSDPETKRGAIYDYSPTETGYQQVV